MSVLIKGMEMPKGCATCPYCDRAWNKPKCKAKSMQGRFMEQRLNLDRTRQKLCPLVPVPKHGRLIDADALADVFRGFIAMYDSCPFSQLAPTDKARRDELQAALAEVINAPTIIPAEEGET